MEIISKSLSETEAFAKNYIQNLEPHASGATVVGLYGDLGAGKTAFAKCVAKILGLNDDITSPTFVIEKRYILRGQKFKTLVHIDSYRLNNGEELSKLEWEYTLKDPGNLVLVEWPEKVYEVMPPNHKRLEFEFVDENTRKIRSK